MKSPSILALTMLSVTAAISPAYAEEAATEIIRTADLNLNSEAGQRALQQRIIRAAREVCGTASDVDLEGKNAVRQCREQVIAEAAVQRDQILAAKSGATIIVAAR